MSSGAILAAPEQIVRVPLSSSDLIPSIMEGYNNFLQMPQEYRDRFTFDRDARDDVDDGYVRRKGTINQAGETYDLKAFFHYNPMLPQLLHMRKVDYFREEWWFERSEVLWLRAEKTYYEHLASIDRALSTNLEAEARAVRHCHKLRLLSYDPLPANTIIGKEHTDRDDFTVHIWENFPGLRFAPFTDTVKIDPDIAIVFPGQKAEVDTRIGHLYKATPHLIMAEESQVNRQSIVFFGHRSLDLSKHKK
jgi:isopenicillin N synthase-like dioxygenase